MASQDFNLATQVTSAIATSTRSASDVGPIIDALYRFGLAQDRRYDRGARELFESAFTIDAELDFRPAATRCGLDVPLMRGRKAITDIILDPDTLIDTTHVITNPRVQMNDAEARLTAIVEAQHLPRGDHSRHALLKNMYAVALVRHEELWRMKRVFIDCVWFTGDPRVITGS